MRAGADGRRLAMLSASESTFKVRSRSKDAEGNQDSRVSVFAWGTSTPGHPHLSSQLMERGIDLLCPTWHLFDLLPTGRGDWYG
jgi:predicted dithiol-disulfide oxidoreductase (DUF899 family)